MMSKKNPLLKKIAIDCYLTGISQKEIAEQLSITEKTLGIWLKPIKEKEQKNKEDIEKLNKRLDSLLNDSNSNTSDIYNITNSILNLENTWFNNSKKGLIK